VAYAAFCGVSNVLVYGPLSASGTVQYARAVQEALGLGPYLQLHVLIPMTGELEQDVSAEGVHLSELARPQYGSSQDDEDSDPELFGTWEIWNTIQTMCSYSTRLSIGTLSIMNVPHSRLLGVVTYSPCLRFWSAAIEHRQPVKVHLYFHSTAYLLTLL